MRLTWWSLPLCGLLAVGCGPKRPGCREGQVAARHPAVADPSQGFHIYSHAHNDYEHTHPLQDALDNQINSVEADIYWSGGDFQVSHEGIFLKGKLKDLYLDPLQARVNENNGSVYGDGVPFHLVIDLKEKNDKLPQALNELLESYPMFTQYSDGKRIRGGAVDVIFTGDDTMKKALVAFPQRDYARDSNDYAPDDPPDNDNSWVAYALNWPDYFSWNGSGAVPADDEASLTCIQENATANGRSVRIYGAPDNQATWQWELDHGVRFINTDDLPGLNAFLDSAKPQP